jgi:hypothetical protein
MCSRAIVLASASVSMVHLPLLSQVHACFDATQDMGLDFAGPDEEEPRRSTRENAGVIDGRFSDSIHSGSGMDSRLGGRHERVHKHSRADLQRQLEERTLQTEAWLHEVQQLIDQCEGIVREMPPEHAPVVRVLQEALMELVTDAEGTDEAVDGASDAMECDPCAPDATECESDATEQEQVASAFFQQVAEELAWTNPTGALPVDPLAVVRASFNGRTGGLMLTSHHLAWIAKDTHISKAHVRLPLSSIREQRASLLKSPFGNLSEFLVATSEHATGSYIRFACGSDLAATEAFAREVVMAMDALPATATTAASAATSTAAVAAATVTASTAAPARRKTKQVLAAADLRAKLKKVVELQRSHAAGSNAEADAIIAQLATADSKEPSKHTVYKESERLRDVALGFGGYALAKRVIEQFINMPAVRLLLPADLRARQAKMADAEHAVELMGIAKEFFTSIFGVGFRGGRLSDEDRNTFAAASAAFLPRDLFKKRGRAAAASRLSGLGYRQLHRGSDARRELEDRACGWRRVRTAEHKDKVNYGPLKEFWHSDLASTPDNQNKDMVRSPSSHAEPRLLCRPIVCSYIGPHLPWR